MANNTTPKDISPFTRTLWWIAGATSDILEKYPSEYAKFSAIGMTISMTCLVAFVSGMAAAWYFSSNIIATIGFGFFWALLIFCIDRALVVTMKKSTQSMSWRKRLTEALKIIIPRAILAVLVALLMSIPLELIVFEDIIDAELPNYESKKLEDASRIGYDASRKNKADKKIKALDKDKEYSLQNLNNATQEKSAAERAVNELIFQINNFKAQRNNPNTARYRTSVSEVNKANAALRNPNLDNQQREVLQSKKSTNAAIMKEETRKWTDDIDIKLREAQQKLEAAQKEKAKKTEAYEEARQMDKDVTDLRTNARKNQADAEKNIDIKVRQLDSIQKKTNKFILHYSVLEYAVYDKIIERIPIPKLKAAQEASPSKDTNAPVENEGSSQPSSNQEEEYEFREEWHYRNSDALWMLWLIRFLFFVFEMMPTVVKAVSKPGPYERECEAQDEQMASFFSSNSYRDHMQKMLNDKLQHERQLADDRRNTEKSLHDHILSKIQDAQKDVAVNAINKWRSEQLRAMSNSQDVQSQPSSPNTIIPTFQHQPGQKQAQQNNQNTNIGDEFD